MRMNTSSLLVALMAVGNVSAFVGPQHQRAFVPVTTRHSWSEGSAPAEPGSEGRPDFSSLYPASSSIPPIEPVQEEESYQQFDAVTNPWERTSNILVQGSTLKTWSFTTPTYSKVQVLLKTDGRPLNSKVELWHGPDYTPVTMDVYIENGVEREFNTVITMKGGSDAIAVRNTNPMEFPLTAGVTSELEDKSNAALFAPDSLPYSCPPRLVQGAGSVATFPFDASIEHVQILLKTDERNIKARVELIQGPNTVKQSIEYYASNGYKNPFFAIIDTPGVGNLIRIINKNTMEFPFTAYVQPFEGYD